MVRVEYSGKELIKKYSEGEIRELNVISIDGNIIEMVDEEGFN